MQNTKFARWMDSGERGERFLKTFVLMCVSTTVIWFLGYHIGGIGFRHWKAFNTPPFTGDFWSICICNGIGFGVADAWRNPVEKNKR